MLVQDIRLMLGLIFMVTAMKPLKYPSKTLCSLPVHLERSKIGVKGCEYLCKMNWPKLNKLTIGIYL